MRKIFLLLSFYIIILVDVEIINAQNVGIGVSTFVPDSSALLEIKGNKGLLIPRMTTAERDAISSPAQSLLIFNTDTKCYEGYIDGTWIQLVCGCQTPSQPGTITGTTSLCQNATGITYSISPVSGATTYTWSVPSGASITSGQGTTNITVNFGTTSGNISVTAGNGCGTSTAQTLAVNLQSAPAQPGAITGNTSPCQNATGITYSISPVSGATTYTWTVPSGATIVSGQSTTSITVNFGTTSGNISVTAGNNCGTSTAQTLAVNLQSAPAQPGAITGNTSPCQNATGITYSISPVSGATTYTWTVPSGATIVSGQGTTSITVNFGTTSGNISVTAGNSCGTSTAQTLAVNLQSAPAQPSYFTNGSSKVCPGTSVIYSINAVSGATGYVWSVPTGWTITNNTGTSITVTSGSLGQNGNISVYAYNSCGNSTTLTMAVLVAKVIGIQVGFGFYGYQSGSYSEATLNFNTSYTSWVDASCDTQSGSCSCSGNANVLHVSYTGSGSSCLGTSILKRKFYFTSFPTSVNVNLIGTGVHSYQPHFYWIYSDGNIETIDWNEIETCGGEPFYYNNWNVSYNCTLQTPPCH
jgi:hypothetical protein